MNRAKIAGLTGGTLLALVAAAIVLNRLRQDELPTGIKEELAEREELVGETVTAKDLNFAVEVTEARLSQHPDEDISELALALEQETDPNVGSVDEFSLTHRVALQLRALKRGTLRKDLRLEYLVEKVRRYFDERGK
jgi:hypothetical protein